MPISLQIHHINHKVVTFVKLKLGGGYHIFVLNDLFLRKTYEFYFAVLITFEALFQHTLSQSPTKVRNILLLLVRKYLL